MAAEAVTPETGVRERSLKRWFGRPARWLSFLAGGVPGILVFPAVNLSYVAWFALVPAIVLFARSRSPREAVARGWWFGAGMVIAMLWWMAPEIGPGLPLVGVVAGGLYAPFAMSVYTLLRPAVLRARGAWWRAAAALIVVPSCWLLPEWARSYQGLGGPWDLYGASQWQHPAILALAAIGGVWLISVALLMANVALYLVLITATSVMRRRLRAASAPSVWLGVTGLAVFAVVAGAGPLAFALTSPAPAVRSVSVALVQPGLLKKSAAQGDASQTLTAKDSSDGAFGGRSASPGGQPPGTPEKVDLIVWGESSIDEDLTQPSSSALLHQIEALSAADQAEILVNQDAIVPGKGHEKWGVLVSQTGVKGIYAKTRLVPFGEYVPFRQQLGWLSSVSKAAGSDMVPGDGAHLLHATDRSGQPLPIGDLICFESAFSDMSRVDADLGAQLIVYQSATSTFQGTWGPDQQASLGAIRAAETGRPVVQAALTGDSVAFDAQGRQLAWLGQSVHGAVTVRLGLPSASARTFYDEHGDYAMWAGVMIAGLAALLMIASRRGFLRGPAGGADDHEAQYDPGTGQPVAP
jgi:apolipoprotein N-acyltransferase